MIREQTTNNNLNGEVGPITNEEQRKVNSSLNINEIKLRDFQFKINNKILMTNSLLYKISKEESNLCSFCQKNIENIHHLLCTCDTVKIFWDNE